jgi:hypothetical protein
MLLINNLILHVWYRADAVTRTYIGTRSPLTRFSAILLSPRLLCSVPAPLVITNASVARSPSLNIVTSLPNASSRQSLMSLLSVSGGTFEKRSFWSDSNNVGYCHLGLRLLSVVNLRSMKRFISRYSCSSNWPCYLLSTSRFLWWSMIWNATRFVCIILEISGKLTSR